MERITRYRMMDLLQALAAAAAEIAEQWRRDARRTGRRRAAPRELHRLSDHLLKDIGLHRSQIDALYRD